MKVKFMEVFAISEILIFSDPSKFEMATWAAAPKFLDIAHWTEGIIYKISTDVSSAQHSKK